MLRRALTRIRAVIHDSIAFMPLMYPLADNRFSFRICALARPYLIFYLVDETTRTVDIVKIIHGAQGSKR